MSTTEHCISSDLHIESTLLDAFSAYGLGSCIRIGGKCRPVAKALGVPSEDARARLSSKSVGPVGALRRRWEGGLKNIPQKAGLAVGLVVAERMATRQPTSSAETATIAYMPAGTFSFQRTW